MYNGCINLQFLYVNQSFAPAPDVDIGTMFDVSSFCNSNFQRVIFISVTRPLCPPIDVIGALVVVWRIRGKIIRTALCCVVYDSCAQTQ